MSKKIYYVIGILILFFLLFILTRLVTLLVIGFPFETAFYNSTTPLGTPLFWNCLAVLGVLLVLYGIRIYIIKYNFDHFSKPKAIVCITLIFGALIGGYIIAKKYHKAYNQKIEYHYHVPELSAVKKSEDSLLGKQLIKGANVFNWDKVSERSIIQIKSLGIEWVTIMPFDYQEATDSPKINHLEELPNLRTKDTTFLKLIKLCKDQDLKVVFKPHLWINSGWRDDLCFETKRNWNLWFENYKKLTLHYAKVAQIANAEMFCIGTELLESVQEQPELWSKMITEIKGIYKGELTYAANWDKEYQEIPFWGQLDYIGVQAYFPMKVNGKKSFGKLKSSLKPHLDTLENFAKARNKKVLFTEMGYKSVEKNTAEPWTWPKKTDVFTRVYSEESQSEAYEVLFSSVFDKDWFAGGLIWEYNLDEDDGPIANQRYNFSPRYKDAENVIKKYYLKDYNESQ